MAWSECPRTRLDDAGNRIFRPATGYAIEPTAHISRRPHAHDAVAGQGVRRVARMVQEPSLQAPGPPTARSLHCRAGMERGGSRWAQPDGDQFEKTTAAATAADDQAWSAAQMTVTDNAAALFFRAVARDPHPTHAWTAHCTLRSYEECSNDSFDGCRPEAADGCR